MKTKISLSTFVGLLSLLMVVTMTAGWIYHTSRINAVHLPAVSQFQLSTPTSETPLDTPAVSISPMHVVNKDGHTEAVANDVVLYGDRGGSYCIYRLGPFSSEDQLASLAVTTNWVGENDLKYQVAVADFAENRWKMSKPIDQGRTRHIDIPELQTPFNDNGEMYLAVVVDDDDSALILDALEVSLDLAQGNPAGVNSGMLDYEIVGVPVAIPLSIRDGNRRIVTDFSDNLTLLADNGETQMFCNAEFYDGKARPTLTFDEPGTYKLSIVGANEELNGELGSIDLYETKLPVYSMYIAEDTLASLNDNLRSNQYQPAKLSIAGGAAVDAMVRFRGQSRRSADKRSWKVKLVDKADFEDGEWGYDRDSFNLITDPADTTMLREKLSYDLMRDLGVPTPRTRFIHLRLNDQFQGLYLDVENPRKDWLKAMGLDNDGSLYKAELGNLSPLGNASAYEERFEKKTREDEAYTDLAELCTQLAQLGEGNTTEVAQGLDDMFFMDQFVNYVVGLTLVSSRENWIHNYYLYHDMDETGKWLIFPWDMDMTWSYDTPGRLAATDPVDMHARTNALMLMFFNNPRLMERFRHSLDFALENVFTTERINQRIDEYYTAIGPDVLADWQKKGTNEEYLERVEGLKLYVQDRRSYLAEELTNS